MSNDDGVPPIPPPPPESARPNPYASVEGTAPAASPYGAAPTAGTPGAPPPYGAVPGAPAPATPGKGMAITALILGIVALLGVAIPILNVFSLIMAIVGLVLGIIALRKYTTSKGLPVSAVIISAIATLLALVFVVLYTIGFVVFLQESEQEGIFDPIPSASPAPEITEDPDDGAAEGPDEGEGDGGTDVGDGGVLTPESGPGSADEPLAIGETVVITDGGVDTWEVSIDTVSLDGTEQVIASNDLNEPPADGFQYAVVTLTATNIGASPGDPWFGVEIVFRDAGGSEHTQFDHNASSPPPAWIGVGTVDVGETVTGNTVVMIPADAPADGAWLLYSYYDLTGYFFQAE